MEGWAFCDLFYLLGIPRTKGQHLFLALSFDPSGRSRPVPVYYVRPRARAGTVINAAELY